LGIAIWILNPIWERCWDYMVKQDETLHEGKNLDKPTTSQSLDKLEVRP
jgi:hypothetical protein